ncbi:MAG: heterodisulfide reductase-related iron-sulfur binding cluster [Thermodesulfobacteriota bacterium]|nr:heterodisulfide reductase-related iron-sulfur binding cluster [Thermodesulfobacteriota bacterium]
MINYQVDSELYREVAKFGARDMEVCMQCAVCSASCPLSTGTNPFPRKIYRYLQLGFKDKLLASPEPWLCYYCGDCNIDCPRGAEPAETMMATRRWLTAQYDWTGLARRFYLSEAWEIGALAAVALGVILLFLLGHGPIITDRVSVNTFAPVLWIEIGDLTMAAILSTFLLSNAFRMYRFIMKDTKAPLSLYITEAKTFVLNILTQKRWRKCGEDRRRWLMHFILVTGYLTMMTLIIVCIRWFQVDDSSWHFTSIFGYYATAVLLFITVEMFRSRRKKEEAIHRYSEFSDWLFLILLFFTTLTGILMHLIRLAGWPMGTYVIYVIHLAIAVPMLVIEVPFGKWSHLFYRPLAIFLAKVKEKASKPSQAGAEDILAEAGEAFMSCIQCGTCTSGCPWNQISSHNVSSYNPRRILREISMDAGTDRSVDRAAWSCVTCNVCGVNCPRGIEIIDVIKAVRMLNVTNGKIPEPLKAPLNSLQANSNPWNGVRDKRMEWAEDLDIPDLTAKHEYGLFTCCTTAYDPDSQKAGRALPQLLTRAGVSFGTPGTDENCCGDPAHKIGEESIFAQLVKKNTELFLRSGVRKILTTSPHCLNAFRKNYPELAQSVASEHYTELLDRLIAKGYLKPIREMDRIVTFHDPCYLGRHNGIYEAPRRILQSIPGLHLVEMFSHKEGSLCCGGGGGGAWRNLPVEQRFGVLRIREALGTGAKVIATACPYCIRMLTDAVRELGVGNRIVVRDVAELLLQSVVTTEETDTADRVGLKIDQEACHV